jgi:hypothetical protein
MTKTGRSIWLVGGLWAAVAGGCATTRGGAETRSGGHIRGTMHLAANQPQLALAGPAHLLHVDYSENANLELFSVQRRAGQADCTGPVRTRMFLHANRPNVIDVDVPADQVVCLEASAQRPGRREVAVSWHATTAPEGPRTLAAVFGLGSVQP